jgi:hypothetical protein
MTLVLIITNFCKYETLRVLGGGGRNLLVSRLLLAFFKVVKNCF